MLPQYYTPPISQVQMSLSAAIRNQWVMFENWLAGPRGATELRRTEILRSLHDDFVKSKRMRPEAFHATLQQEYNNDKIRLNRHLDEELVLLAQLEWERRLAQASLKAEDWIDMTPAERHSVERLLGGDLQDEEFTIVDSTPEGVTSTSMASAQPQAPITQTKPSTPYSFVSPQTLGDEEDGGEDDEDSAFETFFPVDAWMWEGGTDRVTETHRSAAAFARWATEGNGSPELLPPQNNLPPRDTTRVPAPNASTAPNAKGRKVAQPPVPAQSSHPTASTSSIQGTRTQPPPQVIPVAANTSMFQPAAAEVIDPRSTKPRAPAPRYVGPILHDPHDTKSEEAEFESYKVEIRVKKIWEFHFEAAELDAQLARTLCDRRLDKVEVRRHIAEHGRRVEELRLVKEDERKTMVELERSKRVAEINRRGALLNTIPDQRQLWGTMLGKPVDSRDQKIPREAERKSSAERAEATANTDLPASFNGTQTQSEKARVSAEQDERRLKQHSETQTPSTSKIALDPTPNSRSQRSQEAQPQKMASKNHQKQPSRSSEKAKDPFASFPSTQNPERKTENREASNVPVRQRRESEAVRKGGVNGISGFGDPQGSLWGTGSVEVRQPVQQTAAAVASTSRTTLDPVSSSNAHRAQEIWTPAGVEMHAPGASKRTATASKSGADSAPKVPPSQDQMEWTAVDWRLAGRDEPRDPIEPKQTRAKAKISTIQLPPVTPVSDTPGSATSRLRRSSDPPSPSPKLFAVQKQKSGPAAMESTARSKPAGVLKKPAPARPPKSVTVEEVSDEDDPWELGRQGMKKQSKKNAGDHPADANSFTIIEPKPSIPTATFTQIFQYMSEELAAESAMNAGGSDVWKKSEQSSPSSDWVQQSTTDSGGRLERGVPLPADENTNNKAKHVRWTPSVINDSPSSTPVSLDDEQNILSMVGAFSWTSSNGDDPDHLPSTSSTQTVQPRSQVPSLVQPVEASPAPTSAEIWQPAKQKRNEKKGKGKGKGKGKTSGPGAGAGAGAGGQQGNEGSQDELEWFAREAIENLKQQRSKPASAV